VVTKFKHFDASTCPWFFAVHPANITIRSDTSCVSNPWIAFLHPTFIQANMKKILVIVLMAATLTALLNACTDSSAGLNKPVVMTHDSLVNRGQYLVNIMGCNDCHSPKRMGPHGPEPDPALLLSGHPSAMPLAPIDPKATEGWVLFNMNATAMVGPWGISYSANLTSDSTGIGGWSEKQFFKAIREGKYKGLDGNRMILPPMPWPMYAKASDEDLKAIFTYLKSTKPVKNVVPAAVPPDQLANQ
jgi:hypothetical protein